MNDNVTFSAGTYGTASPKWGYSKNEKKPTSMMTREELLKAGIIKPATKPMDDSRPGRWYAGRIVSLGDRRVCPQCRRWFDTAELCHKLCPECLSQRNARNYAKNAEERRRKAHEYYEGHRVEKREYYKKYYAENTERCREYVREYRRRNKEIDTNDKKNGE